MLNYILRIIGLQNAINVERSLIQAGAMWINNSRTPFFETFNPTDEMKQCNILFVLWDEQKDRYELSYLPGSKHFTNEILEELCPTHSDLILTIRNTKAKQVCVWRNDLKVRTGKKMAQSGHAFEAYTKEADECDMFSPRWFYEYGGKRKIVVSVINEEELDNLAQTLDQLSISHTVIVDSGFTEFNGVPTKTCLGIHPVFDEDIDGVTGNLSLY